MIDMGSIVNTARVVMLRTEGAGEGRCVWERGEAEQCAEAVPSGTAFCPTHAAIISASTDPYVMRTWENLHKEAKR